MYARYPTEVCILELEIHPLAHQLLQSVFTQIALTMEKRLAKKKRLSITVDDFQAMAYVLDTVFCGTCRWCWCGSRRYNVDIEIAGMSNWEEVSGLRTNTATHNFSSKAYLVPARVQKKRMISQQLTLWGQKSEPKVPKRMDIDFADLVHGNLYRFNAGDYIR